MGTSALGGFNKKGSFSNCQQLANILPFNFTNMSTDKSIEYFKDYYFKSAKSLKRTP